jgi:hypothetical protein
MKVLESFSFHSILCLLIKTNNMKTTILFIASFIFSFQIFAQPCQADFTWYQDTTTTQTVIAINNSTGSGVLTYSWDFGDGNTSTLAYPTHQYTALGSYEVCLTIMDASSNTITCTAFYCDTVFVTFKSLGFTLNVHPPSFLGIKEIVNSDLDVYPNPVDNILNVDLNSGDIEREMFICDILGQKVMEISVYDSFTQIDVKDLPSGVYFLNTEGFSVRRFVKD